MLFKKQRSKTENPKPEQDKIAGKIARYIIKAQTKFARVMNKSFSALSITSMKVVVILFCLGTGGLSLYLVCQGLFEENKGNAISPAKVHTPKYFDKAGDEIVTSVADVDEETWGKVQLFKTYMDSLKTNSPKNYDSIVSERPGLMDSIAAIEDIYYSQKIK